MTRPAAGGRVMSISFAFSPFLFSKWPLPYIYDGQRVGTVRCKSGLAMLRNGTIAHRVAAAAVIFSGGKARYAARWLCKGNCQDAVILANADHLAGICVRCEAAAAGPVVYRCYGASGELLYIGSTSNRSMRLTSHRRSPWWPEVADVQFQDFPTITAARIAERLAIQREHPVRNRQHQAVAS